MGIRTYEVVVERRTSVKAPNKSSVQAKIESQEVPIYEGEKITSIKEKLPTPEKMDVAPAAYTPKNVLKRDRQKPSETAATQAEQPPVIMTLEQQLEERSRNVIPMKMHMRQPETKA